MNDLRKPGIHSSMWVRRWESLKTKLFHLLGNNERKILSSEITLTEDEVFWGLKILKTWHQMVQIWPWKHKALDFPYLPLGWGWLTVMFVIEKSPVQEYTVWIIYVTKPQCFSEVRFSIFSLSFRKATQPKFYETKIRPWWTLLTLKLDIHRNILRPILRICL